MIKGINKKIVKNGDTYWIFYLDENRLLCSKLYSNDTFHDIVYLTTEEVIDYDVDIDENGNTHIICILTNGHIDYYINTGGIWKNSHLYKYNPTKQEYGGIIIKAVKNEINIIYSIKNLQKTDTWTLMHYRWDSKQWKMNAIAQLNDQTPYFQMYCDKNDNIFAIYNNTLNGSRNTYFIRLHQEINKWSHPVQLATNVFNNTSQLFVDNENIMHFIWQNKDGIFYRKKHPSGWPTNSWSETNKITELNEVTFPNILLIRFSLWILWQQGNDIYCSMSSDMGTTWTNPFKYETLDNNYTIVKYTDGKKNSNYKAMYLYEQEGPNLYFALIDDFLNKTKSKDNYFSFYIKELQSYTEHLVATIKALEEEKLQLKNTISKQQAEISYAEDAIEKFNIELVAIKKQNDRITDLYNDLRKKYQEISLENKQLKEIFRAPENSDSKKGIIRRILTIFRSL